MKRFIPILLLLLLACIWGSSFILMKRGMFTTSGQVIFSAAQVGAIRMFIAGLVLQPLTVINLKKIKTINDFISLAIVGFCGNFFPAFLFTYAETEISSGFAGMLNSFTPIFALLIGVLVFKQKLSTNQLIGLSIAFAGMILLVSSGSDLSSVGSWKHKGSILLATVLYATSLNTLKHKLGHFSALEIASLSFGILFIPSVIVNFQVATPAAITSNSHAMEGLFYISILSVVGTAIALIIFNRIIALTSTVFASSVTYLIPIVAVLTGLAFGEQIVVYQVLAIFVVLAGVYISNLKRKN